MIAETRGGDPNHVVVVGAHLDSVPEGPGINDDGSGTATLLAHGPGARARAATTCARRSASCGSAPRRTASSARRYYAENLSQTEVDKIDVMLDYDMLASANYIRVVYDGDGDDAEDRGEPGRAAGLGQGRAGLRRLVPLRRASPSAGRRSTGARTTSASRLRGIPAGGMFAGAEGVKTAEEEAIYGGAAGSWYDPCYHQICDNLTTVLTGVPPLSAEGLAPDGDRRREARRPPQDGGRRDQEPARAVRRRGYAVYYFAASKDAFGTKPGGHKPPKRAAPWRPLARPREARRPLISQR